jgi:hypothetical protein
MKRVLLIAVSILLLSGCIAEWKNPHGPKRWHDQAAPSPENRELP